MQCAKHTKLSYNQYQIRTNTQHVIHNNKYIIQLILQLGQQIKIWQQAAKIEEQKDTGNNLCVVTPAGVHTTYMCIIFFRLFLRFQTSLKTF